MIEALLQGKLSTEQENMEDVLTSMVFGSFRRAPADQGLLPFLMKAEDIFGSCPLTKYCNQYSAGYDQYEFWPFWQGFDNVDSCEPDVVIKLDAGNEKGILVLIEAKYHSGISSLTSEGTTITQQIAKEWLHLDREAKKHNRKPWMIYLTTDLGKIHSIKDIDEAHREIKEKYNIDAAELTISWLSWRVLSKLFNKRQKNNFLSSAMSDIGRLARRLNLVNFEGIPGFKPLPRFQYKFKKDNIIVFAWNFHMQQITAWRFINDT